MPSARRLVVLVAVWTVTVAATPLPVTAPLPDLAPLVPFAKAPVDKPRIDIPEIPLPPPPVVRPAVPLAPLILPSAERPLAYITPPRGYPCLGAWLAVAQALECGKDRFLRGEYAEAAKQFESAVHRGADREFLDQARYWLGESQLRLGLPEQADWTFRQVGGRAARTEWETWAAHASAWLALRLRDPVRARDTFARLTAGPLPASIQGWAFHGLGLAHYALGEYAEAERAWAELGRRGVPPALARDHAFWSGEVAIRVGQPARAHAELHRFAQGGAHALLHSGLVRLGWAALDAGEFAASVAAFRAAQPRTAQETEWLEAGLALALARSGDPAGAQQAAQSLLGRRAALGVPVAAELVHAALLARRTVEVHGLVQELLAANLSPGVRAWVLLAKGEASRVDGNRDEARTQYELADKADPGSALAEYARFRLARANMAMREFGQAASDAAALAPGLATPEMRAAAFLLHGEAAYYAGAYAAADGAFRRLLVEFPRHPEIPAVRLSLAWVALRQGHSEAARQLFLEFVRAVPEHPAVPDALLLAAEIAIEAGDVAAAQRELDQLIRVHAGHPRTDFARLNRAILMIRQGQPRPAQAVLRDWIARAPFPPLLGRAHLALGVALLGDGQPQEAMRQFAAAQKEGVGALASLGTGIAALAAGDLDPAARALTEARDTGTATVAAVADYGLAAVALRRGATREFKEPALTTLRAAPTGPMAPRLLYVLTAIAVDEQDWNGALGLARKLVTEFPNDDAADDALERVGAAAAKAGAWPVVRDSYALMRERYPMSPFLPGAQARIAEAAFMTGRPDDARHALEHFVATSPGAVEPRHWMMLARAREQAGDRRGAVDAYARASRGGAAEGREARMGQARLLLVDQRWREARAALDQLLRDADPAVVLEAAYGIGEAYRQEGDLMAAAEYYMTAGYLAPESSWGRKGLLAAAQTFAEARHPAAAATVFRKLLAQADLPAELAQAAQQGLRQVSR